MVLKASEFCLVWKRENSWLSLSLEVHSLIPIRRHGWVQRSSVSLKGGNVCWSKLVLSKSSNFPVLGCVLSWAYMDVGWRRLQVACCLKLVLFLSLNDDGERNVLEVIQNLELLTDLRETSWIKFMWFWLDLDVVGHGLNMYGNVLSFVAWNMGLDVVSDFMNMWYDEVVMAYDENLGRNSDGIWVYENFQEGWCHWHRSIVLSWHDMKLTQEVLHFRDH